jgi:hypothetical protein
MFNGQRIVGLCKLLTVSALVLLAGRQLERVLAGSNGNSGTQLRLDNSGARLLAGGRLATAVLVFDVQQWTLNYVSSY